MRSIEIILAFVVVATVVAALAERVRAPAPSLLVLTGLAAGVIPGVSRVQVTPDTVSLVVLPPLLYAAGQELPLRDLRAVWRPVAVLATGLVLASAVAVDFVARAVTPLTGSMAFVLGAVLASTDPVAVGALSRRLPLPTRLNTVVQAESLFNDATSLVLFNVALGFAVGTAGTGALGFLGRVGGLAGGIVEFAVLGGGGGAVGLGIAAAVVAVRRRVSDPVLETVVALVTPYATYVLAEALGVSGVTAVVVASVIISSRTARLTTAQSRLQLHSVYETVVFLLESVVFALIGLELPAAIAGLAQGKGTWWAQALAVAGTLIAVRALWVFPVLVFVRRQSDRRPWREATVATWAGARGVIPLAAALSIPLTDASGAPVPGRDLVLVLTTGVIICSLVVQGLTLEPLVRRTGVARPAASGRHEATLARLRITEAGLSWLEQLAADDTDSGDVVPDDMIERLYHGLQARVQTEDRDRAPGVADGSSPDDGAGAAATYLSLRHNLLAAQRDELTRLHASGEIGDATRRSIQRQLDLEEAGLADT
jgi:monovalent cation/hydrogen antiporter